jgi:hypothetical protein
MTTKTIFPEPDDAAKRKTAAADAVRAHLDQNVQTSAGQTVGQILAKLTKGRK